MSHSEFKINISRNTVSARYGTNPLDAEKSIPWSPDPVILQTAHLLEKWLNHWERIEKAHIPAGDKLLGKDTIEVVGAQLWRLILDNAIGIELQRQINLQHDDQSLHVLINFDEGVDKDLRGLPWEFLCVPGAGREGFLATQTNLLLTRYVTRKAAGRSALASTKEKLGVLFVNLLPPDIRSDFSDGLRDLRNAVAKIDNIYVPDEPAIVKTLDLEPFLTNDRIHVVHVVGHCCGTPGSPKMYLPTDPNPGWQDPKPLVDALTPDPSRRPRLVILHLCEYEDGDATDNFELVAPDLIQERIPAVLAMQYPLLAAAEMQGIGVSFYRALAKGMWVGRAVQEGRRTMFRSGQLNRRFGTPVLYLQRDGALRENTPVESSTFTATAGPTSRVVLTSDTLRSTLSAELDALVLAGWDVGDVATVRQRLQDVDIPATFEETRDVIDDLHNNTADEELRKIYKRLIGAARKLKREADNGRVAGRDEAGAAAGFWAQPNR